MGKKINPKIFRLGLSEQWRSRWFSVDDYAKFLREDIEIRNYIKKGLASAGIDEVIIERKRGEIVINVKVAKPGLIIGRGGSGIEELRKKLVKKYLDKKTKVNINITEVSNPNLSAAIIVQAVREDIEKRMPFRRVMKQNIEKVMKAKGQGVKIILAGRLNGVEIARTETLSKGKIPLSTLRSNIDYSRGAADTLYGKIGIKVWIYKGEYFNKKDKGQKEEINSFKTVKLFSKKKPDIKNLKKEKK